MISGDEGAETDGQQDHRVLLGWQTVEVHASAHGQVLPQWLQHSHGSVLHASCLLFCLFIRLFLPPFFSVNYSCINGNVFGYS